MAEVIPRKAIDGTSSPDEPFPLQEYAGPWPAVVVDTADPDSLGRIKARAPQVHGDTTEDEFILDADLPWAYPVLPTHDFHVPSVGDGVVLLFWGGMSTNPVWLGQFLGDGDAPDEFVSSYTPEPRTRLLRTANGHSIEMRWVDGDERITIKTPDQKRVEIDASTQAINVIAPTGQINVTAPAGAVNVTGQSVSIVSTGTTSHTSTGPLTNQFSAAANYVYAGLLSIIVGGLMTLTLGPVLLAAPLVVTGLVSLGAAGLRFRLAHINLFQVIEDMLHVQATHTHAVTTAPGTTGVSSLNTVSQSGSAPRAGGLTSLPPGVVSLDVTAMTTVAVEAN
jgi:hypothetical protein